MKDKVLKLMANNIHCIISTVSVDSRPQSAIVGFSEDENLGILIGTARESRKCQNINSNPRVSIVIADEKQKIEIQYEGLASVYESDEIQERLEIHFEKLPSTRRRLENNNQVWISVKPNWVRYVDANDGLRFEEMRLG